LTTDGRVYAIGRNTCLGLPNEPSYIISPTELPITNVADVSTSEGKTLVLTSNNILYGVGVNSNFALGFNILEPKIKELTQIPPSNYNYEKIVAVAPAYSYSVVATEQSNLYVFGQK
jgi:alpha-tubulin suppressor-like RCC1 family protein